MRPLMGLTGIIPCALWPRPLLRTADVSRWHFTHGYSRLTVPTEVGDKDIILRYPIPLRGVVPRLNGANSRDGSSDYYNWAAAPFVRGDALPHTSLTNNTKLSAWARVICEIHVSHPQHPCLRRAATRRLGDTAGSNILLVENAIKPQEARGTNLHAPHHSLRQLSLGCREVAKSASNCQL